MPIQSITGKPGNAKTAFLVDRIMDDVKKAERPLWAAGIDGFRHEEVGCNVFKDPREWNAVRPGETCTCDDMENHEPCDAHVIPNGSLIYIDEAWKWFGHLQDASTQRTTPSHVLKLAEHRHRGIDFVWTYQQPNQIYPFARGLMAEHRHLVRKFGTMFCDAYDWQELCEDVKSQTKRDAAVKSTVAIPKRTFDKYKSAEVHTIKAKIPFRVLALPLLAVLALGLGWAAIHYIHGITDKRKADAGTGADASAAAPSDSRHGSGAGSVYATAADYAAAQTPRFPSIPSSAPLYDGAAVLSRPQLLCMSTPDDCRCLTEQGTRYYLEAKLCRDLARNGPAYDPFKAPPQPMDHPSDDSAGRPQVAATGPGGAAVHSEGTSTPEASVAGYGQMGHGANNAP